jgi:hypothetical protein
MRRKFMLIISMTTFLLLGYGCESIQQPQDEMRDELIQSKGSTPRSIEASQYACKITGHVWLDQVGSTGLNNWTIRVYRVDSGPTYVLVATATSYTHLTQGAGYFSMSNLPTTPNCSSDPFYVFYVWDSNGYLRYDEAYPTLHHLCPGNQTLNVVYFSGTQEVGIGMPDCSCF